ncbi:pantoate--beta-alanine ligase [Mucilaginibacter segetis]|uniref:Pantothenate synthetase n=1 Tax=Mucilaginibacter segetis TaxID=2793071 RepID=A0A934PVB4_9SPHI|nr:pantoate--beta-alanine ligase [Mucilaginibacter segetis]MBK0380307.1 pantoate--beta-alanine ligase [Mucilaginibacter segetis]
MKIFTTRKDLRKYLSAFSGNSVGFVPTMGALHNGHLALITQAQKNNDLVICSIFVNPTQFNDSKDLENYPRPIADDIAKLTQAKCDVLFHPEVLEIYDDNEHWHLNIGELEHLLEGKFRPEHYQGVMQVVYKLLDIVKPTRIYLGQKDYQQYLVVKQMIALKHISVEPVMCPIQRDDDGLALSSRNIHLSPAERQHALALSKTLNWVKVNFNAGNIDSLQRHAFTMLQQSPGVDPEYFELADGQTLLPAKADTKNVVALTAARVGATRLIDNMVVKA